MNDFSKFGEYMFKITTLIENNSFDKDLSSEKGLSVLIDNSKDKIIFDYGLSNKYWDNAIKLGFNPSSFNFGIISHGHNDHCGGARMMLEKNMFHTIYSNNKIFNRKYVFRDNEKKYIGLSENLFEAERRFIFVDDVTEICDGIFAITNLVDGRTESQYIKEDDSVDDFDDETIVVLKGESSLHVITGCCHKGLVSTLKRVKAVFPKDKIDTVIGGLHIHKADHDFLEETVKTIEENNVKTLIVGHCTGSNGLSYLSEHTNCNVNLLYTGSTYSLS